jgi:hypothetical protein
VVAIAIGLGAKVLSVAVRVRVTVEVRRSHERAQADVVEAVRGEHFEHGLGLTVGVDERGTLVDQLVDTRDVRSQDEIWAQRGAGGARFTARVLARGAAGAGSRSSAIVVVAAGAGTASHRDSTGPSSTFRGHTAGRGSSNRALTPGRFAGRTLAGAATRRAAATGVRATAASTFAARASAARRAPGRARVRTRFSRITVWVNDGRVAGAVGEEEERVRGREDHAEPRALSATLRRLWS